MGSTGGGAPTRRILHVDVDAMFVQCAVIAEPERLANEPLILVGGSPSGRGVVTSASYGCRAYGVRSAMATATALRLCPKAIVVRTPGAMIRTKSRELRALLPDWPPVVVMTSSKEQRDMVEGYQLGVNSYIQKPVDFDEFRNLIKQLGFYWLVVNQAPPAAAFQA